MRERTRFSFPRYAPIRWRNSRTALRRLPAGRELLKPDRSPPRGGSEPACNRGTAPRAGENLSDRPARVRSARQPPRLCAACRQIALRVQSRGGPGGSRRPVSWVDADERDVAASAQQIPRRRRRAAKESPAQEDATAARSTSAATAATGGGDRDLARHAVHVIAPEERSSGHFIGARFAQSARYRDAAPGTTITAIAFPGRNA